jgi:Uma2 family endonuclease
MGVELMAAAKSPAFQRLVIHDADWAAYSRLLRVFAERPSYRLTFDRGVLEIMTPLPLHEREAYLLGRFIDVITEEKDVAVVAGRSATFRRRSHRRGLEPDNSYWIANAARVVGLRRIDLRRDPPPDLAIEVDVTRSSLDRMAIYGSLRVSEVWRLDSTDKLTFNALQPDGTYSVIDRSLNFPEVSPRDLLRFLSLAGQSDDTAIVVEFRKWFRSTRSRP